jgi:hypothetical protein
MLLLVESLVPWEPGYSVGTAWVTGWTPRVPFPIGTRVLFSFTVSSPALEPTQHPIQWVSGALFQGIKRVGHEADDSSPSSAEVKNDRAISQLSHTFHGVIIT